MQCHKPPRDGNVRQNQQFGTIPVVSNLLDTTEDVVGDKLRATACLPIDLRWDPNDGSALSSETKLTFPLEPNTKKNLASVCEARTA